VVELRCSGRVGSSCSTSGTRRVNLDTNPLISHEWGKDRDVFTTTSGTWKGGGFGLEFHYILQIMVWRLFFLSMHKLVIILYFISRKQVIGKISDSTHVLYILVILAISLRAQAIVFMLYFINIHRVRVKIPHCICVKHWSVSKYICCVELPEAWESCRILISVIIDEIGDLHPISVDL
jgi:hypothetical protein